MKLSHYIDAGCPALYLRSAEEERACHLFVEDLKANGLGHLRIFVWKPTTGLVPWGGDPKIDMIRRELIEVLAYAEGQPSPAPDTVYVFFRAHFYFKIPEVIQALRDAVWSVRKVGSHLVFIGPWVDLLPEVSEVLTVVDVPPPRPEELRALFDRMLASYADLIACDLPEDAMGRVVSAARGLSAFRAESAAALSLVLKKTLDPSVFFEEKRQMLKTVEALEHLSPAAGFADLGGFWELKKHVRSRGLYFKDGEAAKSRGIIRPPKGVLLIGLPGTGKTLSARAIAGELKLPLYRINVGSLFRSYVGESEAMTLRIIQLLEATAPAVVLFDEFEKAFSGLDASGRADSGVTSRVIAMLLSWMQDSEAPLYRVGTANSLRNLDAALLRLGRWDAVFSVDLPSLSERMDILSIHLRKRGYDPSQFDLEKLAKQSAGFVGAELEAAIEEALYAALSDGTHLSSEGLLEAMRRIVPMSVSESENLQVMREWMRRSTRSVSHDVENT